MYYYPDLIVSNLFYCTCTIRAGVSAPCACLSCSLAFLLLYVVFLSIYDDDDDKSSPVPLSWGSPVGKRNLRWEGFVEKVGFEPGVKEWRSDGCWEWRWCQGWVDKWMRRWIETGLTRLTKWIWKLIPKTRWCISEWAICDFQWGDG